MQSEEREKIQSLFREACTVALVARAPIDETVFLARETLRGLLNERGAFVYVFPESPAEYEKKWSSICAPAGATPPKKAALRIAKRHCAIQELRYEERENDFSIVITPKSGMIKKDNIIVEPLPPDIDAVISFSDEALPLARGSLALPSREHTITIAPDERTITEKTYELAGLINSDARDKRTASALFAALLLETKNFSRHVSETILALGATLLASGADKAYVCRTLARTPNFIQLVGRALARTVIDETSGSALAFVTAKDVEKTKHVCTPELIRTLLDEVTVQLHPERFAVLFWQDEHSVHILTEITNAALRDSFAKRVGAAPEGTCIAINGFRNFSEAEIKIRGIFRDIL